MSNNSPDLLYFKQGNACFLLNCGEQAIAELEFDSASLGFEDGFAVGDDYGRFRVRDFLPHTFFTVYEMTEDDVIYLPRTAWFQLDIHSGRMTDGAQIAQSVLRSVNKYGGYTAPGDHVDLQLEVVGIQADRQISD